MESPQCIESRIFPDDGNTPNHPTLPFLLMRGTAPTGTADPAAWFEKHFEANGWGATWRWTVYPYHHFHSTNHEVLGVARGNATLLLGGENGGTFDVGLGDVIVIPAGVGHKRLESSEDFLVVGGYPDGEEPDLIKSGEGDIDAARERISKVSLPINDPVYGRHGPLFKHWK